MPTTAPSLNLNRPEPGPARFAAVRVPEHRRVLAQPGELLVRGAATLVDIEINEADLRSHRHRQPPALPEDDEDDTTAIPDQAAVPEPLVLIRSGTVPGTQLHL